MNLTSYHAKYYAHDLTRRASGGLDRISMSLFDATVDLNPHQIEAALFALHSPLSKGVILADEVGLGKTIEAGIVLCQYWAERRRRLLVLCPASIRKQWALELQEKFNLPAVVLDSKTYREAEKDGRLPLQEKTVTIMSFHFGTHLTAGHVAFLDMTRLYFELERFKAERGWYNLNLKQENIAPLLIDQAWYQLLIPAEELAFDSFEKVRLWQDIALSLLKKFAERYYTFRKREWELPHLEYQDFAANDPNFLGSKDEPDKGYYRILIDKSQEEIAAKLTELKESITKGELKKFDFQGMKAIWFGRHLYEPLLYVDHKIVEISPVPLNKGERRFVEDLKTFHGNDGGYFTGKELYLLRNLSKGRGVGFFEAGNFHPDFIIWLLTENDQNIVFVDPKGIRNIGATDPKIQFYETIKEIEQRLGDPKVSLDSFIISGTPSHIMRMLWGMDKPAMKQRHVLFQEEDQDTYIREMLSILMPA